MAKLAQEMRVAGTILILVAGLVVATAVPRETPEKLVWPGTNVPTADIGPVPTRLGLLAARQSRDTSECGPVFDHPCAVISLGEKVLYADPVAWIEDAFPSRDDPKLVAIRRHQGGMCCDADKIVLDVSSSRVAVLLDFDLRHVEAVDARTLRLRRSEGLNEIGDDISGIYRYELGSGRPRLTMKIVEYPEAILGEATLPEEILADIDLRKPLSEAIGSERLAGMRADMKFRSRVSVINGRFFVGSGCRERSCDTAGALFVIDRRERAAYALHFDEELYQDRRVNSWGWVDGAPKAVDAAVHAWLRENDRDWEDIVPPDP